MPKLDYKNQMKKRVVVAVNTQTEIKILGVKFDQSGTGQFTGSLMTNKSIFFGNSSILLQIIQSWPRKCCMYFHAATYRKSSALDCMLALN